MALFKFGAQDLSAYARLNPDDGFDPYDAGGFQDPQWLDSPIAEGQVLTSVDITNREQSWPLYLKAANKQALHDLIVTINREIATAPRPLRVQVQDNGATNISYLDVEFARFDPDWSFRRAGKNVMAGTLRVWGRPPYFHTATQPAFASAVAASPALVATVQGLSGDADGQAQYSYQSSAIPPGAAGRIVAAAVLPNPSYRPFFPPASLAQIGAATLVGASGAPASQAWTLQISGASQSEWYRDSQRMVRLSLPAAIYAGRNRVLAAARPGVALGGMAISLIDANSDKAVAPTAVISNQYRDGWTIADLGVVNVPSSVPTSSFDVGIGPLFSSGLGDNQFRTSRYNQPAGAIGGLFVVPEGKTAVHVDELAVPLAGFFGASSTPSALGSVDDYNNTMTGFGAGAGSYLVKSPLGLGIGSVAGPIDLIAVADGAVEHTNHRSRAVVWYNDSPGVSQGFNVGVGRYDPVNTENYAYAYLVSLASTPALYIKTGLSGQSRSTSFLPLQAGFLQNGSICACLEFVSNDDVAYANLWYTGATGVSIFGATWGLGAAVVPVACVGMSATALRAIRGRPMIEMVGSSNQHFVADWRHDRLKGRSVPSESYLIDGVTNEVITSHGSYGSQDRTSSLRGAIPQITPSGALVAVIDGLLDGGAMNDTAGVSVNVRERFTFAR